MIETGWTKDLLIVLGTAGLLVPLFRRLRVGIVLGFLLAGVLLGPGGLGHLVGDFPWLRWITFSSDAHVRPAAELGVLFLLFSIGLGLSLERLWQMRRLVFGVGLVQVLLSAAAIGAAVAWLGIPPGIAVAVGLALSFSSTAIILQLLIEQHRSAAPLGRAALGVLLLQDLMVVPTVILVGVLGDAEEGLPLGTILAAAAVAVVVLAAMLAGGRFLLRPFLVLAARTGSRDLVLAIALFVAIAAGAGTAAAGLSPGLGAFLAGILLGGTEYRHQLEIDVDPFKGLLLGLFFMTVGMTFDPLQVAESWHLLLLATLALLAVKGAAVAAACRAWRLPAAISVEAAFLLAGCGEFALVVFRLAGSEALLPPASLQFMMSVVALTMLATPLLAAAGRKLGDRLDERAHLRDQGAPEDAGPGDHVVVAGFGRVGETVCRLLEANAVAYVALDRDADVVGRARAAGRLVHFGDASRREMLERVGAARARAFVVTPNAPQMAGRMVAAIRGLRPEAPVFARAKDPGHARRLAELGADAAVPEALEGSLQLAARVLAGIGMPAEAVEAAVDDQRAKALAEAAPPPARGRRGRGARPRG